MPEEHRLPMRDRKLHPENLILGMSFKSSASAELWGNVRQLAHQKSTDTDLQHHIAELEDVCLSLRKELEEKNTKIQELSDEVKFQNALVLNYRKETEILHLEISRSREPENCDKCEQLALSVATLTQELSAPTGKLSDLAGEAIGAASLAQELAKERLVCAELRTEIARLRKLPEKNVKIFKILQTLEQTISKSPDETLVAVFGAMKKLAATHEEAADDNLWRAKLEETENVWIGKIKQLKAEHDKMRFDYEAILRDERQSIKTCDKVHPETSLAKVRIEQLERELQVTNELFAKKLATGEQPKHGNSNFYISNVSDLRLFLSLPLARALGELLNSQDAAMRKLVERTLQQSSIREELLEEALREACEEHDLLEVVVADIELSGVRKWREMPAVLSRCGIDSPSLDRKIPNFSDLRVDAKRLLHGRTRDVRDQIIGG